MRDLIDRRLTELRAELEAGHGLQAELEARLEGLRRSMLRISGAMQVLGELAAADDKPGEMAGEPPRDAVADAPAPLRSVALR